MNTPTGEIHAVTQTSYPRFVLISPTQQPTETVKILPATPSATIKASPTLQPSLIIRTPTAIHSPTIKPSLTPRPSATIELSITFAQNPTVTKTPLPSATFDASHSVRRTLSPPAQCPAENPGLVLDLQPDPQKFCLDVETQVLDFLNAGGKLQDIVNDLGRIAVKADLTNDGVPELAIAECKFRIYGCSEGQYTKMLDMGDREGYSRVLAIKDMNLDGVPELIIGGGVQPFSNAPTMYYRILEWEDRQFRNLIDQPDFESSYRGGGIRNNWIYSEGVGRGVDSIWENWSMKDIDKNGTVEFVINTGLPVSFDTAANGPWRAETDIYMWNGYNFGLQSIQVEPPQYRFQAAQDADAASLDGQYDKALDLYQQVIFSDKLDWWSEQQREHQKSVLQAEWSGSVTPTPLAQDYTEYNNLAAYAYYRMMLLHIIRGWLTEAETVYHTLQEKFPSGSEGSAYAEMATAFWEEYRTSQNMALSCQKAIAYATEYPEKIISYIGNGRKGEIDYGWQSRNYSPEDICPFR